MLSREVELLASGRYRVTLQGGRRLVSGRSLRSPAPALGLVVAMLPLAERLHGLRRVAQPCAEDPAERRTDTRAFPWARRDGDRF